MLITGPRANNAIMARHRRRRPPGGHTTAVGSRGLRAPISTDTASHTHTTRSLACPLLTLSSARPFSNCMFRSHGAPVFLSPASSSLTHARRMDGFCNQNADQLGYLAGPSLLTVYVGVVECASASLPPASSSLTHTLRLRPNCGNIFCGKILVPVNDRVFAKNDSQIFRRRQIEQILLQGKKFVFSRQGWVIVYSIPFAFL